MNDISSMLDNFKKLSLNEQLNFFKFHNELKKEYEVVCEENSILKEGLNQARSMKQ